MAENMPTLAAPSELAEAVGEAKIEKIEFCKAFFLWRLVKEADATDDQKGHCQQRGEYMCEYVGLRSMVDGCSDRTEGSRDALPHYTLDHVAQLCGESMQRRT